MEDNEEKGNVGNETKTPLKSDERTDAKKEKAINAMKALKAITDVPKL